MGSAGAIEGTGGNHIGQQTCRNCGQEAHVHRTLSAILHDLIHGVLHLDGKFWLTLPLLVFKLGQFTHRNIDGERAKFVSQMAMFLFSVFAMFAVFQMVGLTVPADLGDAVPSQFGLALERQVDQIETDLKAVDEKLAEPELDPDTRTDLEAERSVPLDWRERLLEVSKGPTVSNSGDEDFPDGVPLAIQEEDGFNANFTGIDGLDEGNLKKWREHPELMLYKLQANADKFSWLLIPLSIPFVWLMFAWRRRFHDYDHAIFVTYPLSFISLLLITASLLALIPEIGGIVALMLFLVPPIHLCAQLRGAYELSHFPAFWRLMMLNAIIWIVALLFLQRLLLLGVF